MAFVPKDWRDLPDITTPLSAAAIEDMETRLSSYTDDRETAAHAYTDTRETAIRADFPTVPDVGAVYRNIATAQAYLAGGNGSFMYFMPVSGPVSLGTSMGTPAVQLISWAPTGYAVAGKTTVMRLLVAGATSGTAPGVNLLFELRPLASASGSGALTLAAGSVVSGSGVTVTAPAANSLILQNSSDFAVPTAGMYCLTITPSGSTAAGSVCEWTAQLQIRHT